MALEFQITELLFMFLDIVLDLLPLHTEMERPGQPGLPGQPGKPTPLCFTHALGFTETGANACEGGEPSPGMTQGGAVM